tara:strand:+ start:115 stop:441 length:327 start_codon:yes stop_codon:yes gene_type:complete
MKKKVHDAVTGKSEILDMTAEEIASFHIGYGSIAEKNTAYKLEKIKNLRLQKLQETDFWVMRGNMSEAQSTYRQSMRDIPQDYSEADYDDLLARDEQGNLTHTVWSKP